MAKETKEKSLIERLTGLFSLKEGRSTITDRLTGTSEAYIDEPTLRMIEDVNNGTVRDLDYYLQHYNSTVSTMQDRQTSLTNRAARLASRFLPALLVSIGVDQVTSDNMPNTAMYVGSAVAVEGMILAHTYIRFRSSVKSAKAALVDLKSYMDDHRDELTTNGSSMSEKRLVEEADKVYVKGSNTEMYHQLQGYHSVVAYLTDNRVRIDANGIKLEDHNGRIIDVEAQVLKNRLSGEDNTARIEQVESQPELPGYTPPKNTDTEMEVETTVYHRSKATTEFDADNVASPFIAKDIPYIVKDFPVDNDDGILGPGGIIINLMDRWEGKRDR